MKKCKDVNIGDIAYIFNSIDGFQKLGIVENIYRGDSYNADTIILEDGFPKKIFMWNDALWDEYVCNDCYQYIIFPESDNEICFLNSILKAQSKNAKRDIVGGIRSLFNIE